MQSLRNAGKPLSSQIRWSAWNFQQLMESRIPDYLGRPKREGGDLSKVQNQFPKISFMSSLEFDLISKTRSNDMGEYVYQRDLRLKATELLLSEAPHQLESIHAENAEIQDLAELKQLEKLSEYAGELLEHRNQTSQRVNDFVDSNPVYLLEQPWREEARFNRLAEMDNRTRAVVRQELRSWLPQELQQHKVADIQQSAAYSQTVRSEMVQKIMENKKEAEAQIQAMPANERARFQQILEDDVTKSLQFVDPTHDINEENIEKCSDVSELRDMAHRVSSFNGDNRLMAIYKRASDLTGDTHAAALLKKMESTISL